MSFLSPIALVHSADYPRRVVTTPSTEISVEELRLAGRNHALPLEALRHAITPVGLHYLLIHFDIPAVDPSTWELSIGGHVERPLKLNLDQIKSRPATTLAVTLECAGNGRARLSPRPLSQLWLNEAVGTAEWTGTRLGPLLAEAHSRDGAAHVVFTGIDRGVQGGIEQQYERSLSLADARRDEVLLVWAINGEPLTEPYVKSACSWEIPDEHLGPGEYYVVGDNRDMASFEHTQGIALRQRIVGKILL